MASTDSASDFPNLNGKRVAFVGKLGGANKREARRLVREHGGIPVDHPSADVDLVVIGADELPLAADSLLDDSVRKAAEDGKLRILSETQLWQQLGLFGGEPNLQLYTPAMLADLLKIPVSVIRSWHRRKLIVPVREVHRLPYFDFQEVATARQLAALLAAGASPEMIERRLAELSRYFPDVERPLAQLSVIVQGRQLLLRQGEGLIEPGGQLRIDFEAPGRTDEGQGDEAGECATVPLPQQATGPDRPPEMLDMAARLDEDGNLPAAIDLYRAVLAAAGPTADVCFLLAELLYRVGDVSAARERYYMAIELDEDFVEARANLGCVLAETGQLELAVAAFQGALRYHHDYPDVHYHLARTLDELQHRADAERHWREFLQLAPNSPWSEEARRRLEDTGNR
ncbi:MAG: tetratricopeptide repeat protein [Planctomycetes bacterium]|nr:tetratricopeptide repeat protein [Planctomycetota bacterium]